jgi:hypothetical protein
VEGDLVRAQVIANLLQNAAKYTEPGGNIRVEGRREAGEMILSVRDDGRGIPGERLASMFELFVQGDEEGLSQGGLGIGRRGDAGTDLFDGSHELRTGMHLDDSTFGRHRNITPASRGRLPPIDPAIDVNRSFDRDGGRERSCCPKSTTQA